MTLDHLRNIVVSGDSANEYFVQLQGTADHGLDWSPLPELTFEVKNLGSVHDGSFCQKPLTVFCGPNNTGKTWTLYCLYLFYTILHFTKYEDSDGLFLLPDIDALNEVLGRMLPGFFNSQVLDEYESTFSLKSPETLESLRNFSREGRAFLMPAERNGLHLFFRELSYRRAALLHPSSRGIAADELLAPVMFTSYAKPIADYLDWLNSLWTIQEGMKGTFHSLAEQLKRKLVGGSYRVEPRTGSIEFRSYRSINGGRTAKPIGLHLTSSAVKSLFALWFYLEHQAVPGNLLMIDEPELNLHPSSQREIARLLVRIVNAGMNVAISTHSDYIVRELNIMIMLHQEGASSLRKRYKYRDDEVLDPEKVGAYLFDRNTIDSFPLAPSRGIYATTFDDIIEKMNDDYTEIYYSLLYKNDVDSND